MSIYQQEALWHDCTNDIEIVLEVGVANVYFNFNIPFLTHKDVSARLAQSVRTEVINNRRF